MNSFSNEKVELTNCQFRRDQVSKNEIIARIRKLSLVRLFERDKGFTHYADRGRMCSGFPTQRIIGLPMGQTEDGRK